MNIEFKCPQCGKTVAADESARGQVAECPYCGKGIVVPRGKPKLGVRRTSNTKTTTDNDDSRIPHRMRMSLKDSNPNESVNSRLCKNRKVYYNDIL